MRRTRLAMLTLAGSLLLSSSGCLNLFGRMQSWRQGPGADCTCYDVADQHDMTVPTSVEGPALIAPAPTFVAPPPSGIPQGPPPRIVPIPHNAAQPMPWTGQQ